MTARRGFFVLGLALSLLGLSAPCGVRAEASVKDGEIDRRALHHDPNGPDQIIWTAAENPRLRFLTLRVTARAHDVRVIGVRLYLVNAQNREAFKDLEMDHCAITDSLEIRTVTVPFDDDPNAPPNRTHWRGYRFWFDDGTDIAWLGADSTAFREERVARYVNLFRRGAELPDGITGISDRILVVPGWAQDGVVTTIALDWRRGQADDRLADDLARARRSLPGLDSLGVTTVLIEAPGGFPMDLCWPPDPTGDAGADSARGVAMPFGRLQALCDAAHRRKMRVMVTLATAAGGEGETDSLLGLVRQGIGCGVDGFRLLPTPGTPDTQWRAIHETARALLPEVYLVLDATTLDPDAANPTLWTTGSRVDAVIGQGVGMLLTSWVEPGGSLPAEELDRRLGLRRLALPAPLARVDWLRDPGDTPDPLVDITRLTLPGAVELPPSRLGRTAAGGPGTPHPDLARLRGLMELRRQHSALRRGAFETIHAAGGQYVYLRRSSDEILLVIVNRDDAPADLRLPLPKGIGFVSTKDVTDILSGARYPIRGGEILLKGFPARSGAIIQLR